MCCSRHHVFKEGQKLLDLERLVVPLEFLPGEFRKRPFERP